MSPGAVAITGCGVVSHAGFGLAPLRDLLHGAPTPPGGPARGAATPPGDPARGGPMSPREPVRGRPAPGSEGRALGQALGQAEDMPPRETRPVPAFELADYVGRKGTRHIDRLTALGLVACKEALADVDVPLGSQERGSAGVVMATSTGSIASIGELAHESLTNDRPYMVNPSRFPNAVMNSCAGQIAIWNSLRGVNSTVAAGSVSSLHAARYARLALAHGRASTLLIGGVEELSPLSAWTWQKAGVLRPGAALGEGCAMFVAEPAARVAEQGRTALAEIVAAEVGFCGAGPAFTEELPAALAACVARALDRAGVSAEEVGAVTLGAGNYLGLAPLETRAVERALGRAPRYVHAATTLGESYSATGALQLAALLALWSGDPAEIGPVALVTSMGGDGQVGCLVVRRGTRTPG